MKQAFACFGVAFILMAVTGFVTGYRQARGPAMVAQVAVNAITPEGDDKNEYFVYRINGVVKCRWNFTSRKLERFKTPADARPASALQTAFVFPVTDTQILTFAGGGAATWKLKDLIGKESSGATKRNIAASIIGGVCGYVLGYKASTFAIPSSDSAEVRVQLNEEKFWTTHLEDMYGARWDRLCHAAEQLSDPGVRRMTQKYLADIATMAMNRPAGMTAVDANSLRLIDSKFERANRSLLTPIRYDTPWWLTWWFVLTCAAGATLLCLGIGTVNDRRARSEIKRLIIFP